MSTPTLHRHTPKDFAANDSHEYHLRTLNMPAPLSCMFSCKRCGKFKSTTGSRSFPKPNSRHKEKICADCVAVAIVCGVRTA